MKSQLPQPNNLFDHADPQPSAPQVPFIVLPRQEYVPRVLEERWYQEQALAEIDRRFSGNDGRRNGKGEILVSPTGCGKTSVASRAIGKWLHDRKRVLILTDMDRLLTQMQEDLEAEGVYPLVEKAEQSALSAFNVHGHCVLASMQTLHPKRLAKWPKDSFDFIVIDECHQDCYSRIVKYFAKAQVLGLTATPIRSDKRSLKTTFNYPYIRTLTLREAIEGWNEITQQYEKPYLSRLEIERIPAPGIDLSKIKIVGKDFDKSELAAELWRHTNFIASAILEKAEDRPTWIYCRSINGCDAIAAALRDMGATAASYTSATPNPRGLLAAFVRGDYQFLTNVNMLIKGVNVPKVSCIALATMNLSIGPVTQKIGRGTRRAPGKENCRVLEFDCHVGKGMQLASVIDAILDGADEPERKLSKSEQVKQQRVRAKMNQIVKTKQELDVIRAYDMAKQQVSEEDAAKRRAADDARRAKYERVSVLPQTRRYDPCSGFDKPLLLTDRQTFSQPATDIQKAALKEHGVRFIDPNMSEKSAAERIRQLENRKRYRYASEAQLDLMINTLGCDPREAGRKRKWEASAWIDGCRLSMIDELVQRGHEQAALADVKVWVLAKMIKGAA